MREAAGRCGECGEPIPKTSRGGFCPRCLLGLAGTVAMDGSGGRDSHSSGHTAGLGTEGGDYELLEMVGEGGMGLVYKARQVKLGRTVALKMLRSGALASEAELKRFRAEAQAAARLQHPNVVGIYEVGERKGQLFFSMEYVEGRTLAQVIGRTPLVPERAARYMKTIAEAMAFAHERKVLHRDLKPGNVLIDKEDRPRITDFGLAKEIEVDSTLTLSGVVLGTPSYMPPEQAAGRRKDVTVASDVYSLGAILYDMITGRPPFRADSPVDTLRQVIDSDPVAPRLLNPKVPRDLETICLKCLRKNPEQRYGTATELADDLARFLRREPILARPLSIAGRTWRWYRRNPVIGTLAGLVLTMGLLQGIAAYIYRGALRQANQNLAKLVANHLKEHLDLLSEPVRNLAVDPQLGKLLVAGESMSQMVVSNQVLDLLREAHHQAGFGAETDAASGGRGEAENWVVMRMDGATVARYPSVTNGTRLLDRSPRDYFKKARDLKQPGAVYYSKIYRSVEDGLFKFGISTQIPGTDSNAPPVGILTLMINTGSAEERLLKLGGNSAASMESQDLIGQEIVVLGPADPADRRIRPLIPGEMLAFLVPELPNGGEAVAIEVTSIADGADLYRDPLDRAGGLKMAAMAEIPGTQYRVLIKSPAYVWPWMLFEVFVVLVCVAILVLTAHIIRLRRARRRDSRVS